MSMELKDLLKLEPEGLARSQHKALKEHTIEFIKEVLKLIQSEEYDKIYSRTAFRTNEQGTGPTGDHGRFIDFDIYESDQGEDIVERIEKLAELKEDMKAARVTEDELESRAKDFKKRSNALWNEANKKYWRSKK